MSLKTGAQGLSEAEAKERLKQYGLNDVEAQKVSLIRIFIKQYANFLMLLLALGAGFSLFLGELVDGLVIAAILAINGILGTIQEYKAEKLTQVLKKHIPQKVNVRRGGQEKIIHRSELTVGDIVIINSGQIISADMRVIKNFGLTVDESSLTGESIGINKQTEILDKEPAGVHECKNVLFAGTVAISGGGEAVVYGTGKNTEFGKIINLTHTSKKRSSFLQQIQHLSDFLFKATLIITGVLFLVLILFKPDFGLNNIFLFAVALAIAIVPEMLPLISTIALTRASLLLAKNGVLVKRLSALEDLGGVNIICTDKTGTITENVLKVKDIIAASKEECLKYALLSSAEVADKEHLLAGSFDAALFAESEKNLIAEFQKTQFIWQENFNPQFRWQFNVFKKFSGSEIAVKGAPEILLERCELLDGEKQNLLVQASNFGKQGLRVLCVAKSEIATKKEYQEKDLHKLKFLGFITFEDPIKDTAKEALQEANHLGLEIKILTGDAPEVATAVARQIGLVVADKQIISGVEFSKATDEVKNRLCVEAIIFARFNPTEKFEIIRRLAVNNSVMFLGEGINDAPSLKIADVGMVVKEASDIAQESADIILTKPDLLTIIKSVILGRQIMSNIAKYILITLTGNFGGLYAISLLSIISPILPLLPTQVLLENILTDVPMIALVNAPVGRNELKKPMRANIRSLGFQATILGFATIFLQFIFYRLFEHLPHDLFRTLWLVEIILFEFVLIISLRSSDWFWKAAPMPFKTGLFFFVIVIFTIFSPFIYPFNEWFHLQPYSAAFLVPIFLIVGLGLFLVEITKKLFFKINHNNF